MPWVTSLEKRLHFPTLSTVLFSCILLISFFLHSCAPTGRDHIDTGITQSWIPGYPNFTFAAWASFEEDEVFLKTYLIIPYSNLVFRSSNQTEFLSRYERNITIKRIVDGNDDGRTVYNRTTEHEVVKQTYQETQSNRSNIHESRHQFEPGTYLVRLSIRDKNTNRRIFHETRVEIPDLSDSGNQIGSVLLKRHQGELRDFRPVSTFSMTESDDSLKVSLQVFLDDDEAPFAVRMNLLRFETDSLPGRPPHLHTPMIGSLQYRGINYERPDTLQSNFRDLNVFSGTIDLDFDLPHLRPGNYRAEIIALSDEGVQFQRARDFAIMPAGFPSVKTIRQMNEALFYISTPREFERLTKPQSNDSLRAAFDTFWAQNIGNRNRALATINQYFTRVEEANSIFTNHKEGWKTDFGMVYILFGPPSFQERFADGISWYYQIGSNNIRFNFERGRTAGYIAPSNNYILRRDRAYEQFFHRQFEDWRRGSIR